MCGIISVICASGIKDKSKFEQFFTEGIILDTIRGSDSTGVFVGPVNKRVKITKGAVSGVSFVQQPPYKDIIKDFNSHNFLVGHNRWATKGKVNAKNAHPFRHGPITMVHNGTLTNHNTLTNKQFDVDSDALCYALSVQSPDEVLSKINGAAAIIWHDERTPTKLYIYRNAERPLHFFPVQDEGILICSEDVMLKAIAERNSKFRDVAPANFKTNHIITIDTATASIESVVEVKKPVVSYSHSSTNSYNTAAGYTDDDNLSNNQRKKARNKRLKAFGYQHKAIVTFIAESFTSTYNGGPIGTLIGRITTSPYMTIKVDNFKRTDMSYKTIFQGEIIDYFEQVSTGTPYFKLYPTSIKNKGGDAILLRGNIRRHDEETKQQKKETPALLQGPTSNNETDEVFTDDGAGDIRILGPHGSYIPKERWFSLVKDGCGVCSSEIHPSDAESMTWMGDSPICSGCIDIAHKIVVH